MFRKSLSSCDRLLAVTATSPSLVRSWALRIASWIPTLLTLTALGALAYWGWYNDWQLSLSRLGDQRTAARPTVAEPIVKVSAAPDSSGTGSALSSASGPRRIEFPSAAAVRKVGLRVVPAQVLDVTRTVTAPGMVDYDPALCAHLTARASGTVWRVDKEIGDSIHKGDGLALIEAAEVAKAKADFLQSFVQFELQDATLKSVKASAGVVPKQSIWTAWSGQFENLERARLRLEIVVAVSLALIFILLYVTYNQLTDVLLIFSGVPFAWVGGVLALWLRSLPFSLPAGVGFIALSGVSVLNCMVLVTFIPHLREQGVPLVTAIEEAAQVRLRPVLMTALVASLGFVPMALSTGVGTEVQRPLATVVIGGVISSTLLTLLVLPVLYDVVGTLGSRTWGGTGMTSDTREVPVCFHHQTSL